MTCDEYVINELMEIKQINGALERRIEEDEKTIREYESKLEKITDVICAFMKSDSIFGIQIDSITEKYDSKALQTLIDELEIDITGYAGLEEGE